MYILSNSGYNPETKSTEIREFNTTKKGLIPIVDDVASLLTGRKGTPEFDSIYIKEGFGVDILGFAVM